MDASILPFLPLLIQAESGALQWPSQLGYALKSLVGGPSVSQVHRPDNLCDAISDLRELSKLPPLPRAAVHGIVTYFDEFITRAAAENFFQNVLPFIADVAFRLPLLLNDHFRQYMNCPSPLHTVTLRVLQPQHSGLVYMNQELVLAVLACAFFCLYPSEGRAEARLSYFNFDSLFWVVGNKRPQQEQKIHCILHYFTRTFQDVPQGMISFERKVLLRHQQREAFSPISEPDGNYWSRSSASFCPIQVMKEGMIEDQRSRSALEVDFANQYLGGGVLELGCVQEEIRFVINPELLAGMLFMPAMQANEAIEIKGAERFSCYTGYSSSFCFAGNYVDTKPKDSKGRRETRIVAIDALEHPGRYQYAEGVMLRETNKAYCGFLDHLESFFSGLSSQETNKGGPGHLELQSGDCKDQAMSSEQRESITKQIEDENFGNNAPIDAPHTSSTRCTTGIATGNWGCGAFGGDVELKSLLQWIAASQAGRPFMQYFTFGSSHGQRLQQIADWIINEKWTVGELWTLLVDYGEKRLKGEHKEGLFDWLVPHLPELDASKGSKANNRAKAWIFSCFK